MNTLCLNGGSDKGVQTIVFLLPSKVYPFYQSDTEQAFMKSLLKHYLGTNGQKNCGY
jgi:hypothetical protein